jgi:hypothetical protein
MIIKNSTTVKDANTEHSYWNNFYLGKFDVGVPSQFCILLATEADKERPIVEFGCGNGRDSIYLACQSFQDALDNADFLLWDAINLSLDRTIQ